MLRRGVLRRAGQSLTLCAHGTQALIRWKTCVRSYGGPTLAAARARRSSGRGRSRPRRRGRPPYPRLATRLAAPRRPTSCSTGRRQEGVVWAGASCWRRVVECGDCGPGVGGSPLCGAACASSAGCAVGRCLYAQRWCITHIAHNTMHQISLAACAAGSRARRSLQGALPIVAMAMVVAMVATAMVLHAKTVLNAEAETDAETGAASVETEAG